MSRLVFTPLHGPWSAGKHGPFSDETTVENPPGELLKAAAGAHVAGAIAVTQGLEPGHVQSQADAEKAQAAAQADGSWQVGQLRQHELDEAQRAVGRLEQLLAGDDVGDDRAQLEQRLAEAVAHADNVAVDVWKRAKKGRA